MNSLLHHHDWSASIGTLAACALLGAFVAGGVATYMRAAELAPAPSVEAGESSPVQASPGAASPSAVPDGMAAVAGQGEGAPRR